MVENTWPFFEITTFGDTSNSKYKLDLCLSKSLYRLKTKPCSSG